MLKRLQLVLVLTLVVVASDALAQGSGRLRPRRGGYLHPQLVVAPGGNVDMFWVARTAAGHELFVAHSSSGGALKDPVRVNTSEGDVSYFAIDSTRPAVAAGSDGALGAAWFDRQGRLTVGISRDGGATFGPSTVVDPEGARPEHAFAAAVFDATGDFFVAWIDTRSAEEGEEEPAQIWMARVGHDLRPIVRNMTGEYTTSVCGCCRPDLSINGDRLTLTFRMAGEDGFRDIYRMRTSPGLEASEPERLGPARWETSACPMQGPVTEGEFTWFLDGSKDKFLLMEATGHADVLREVREAPAGRTPRPVKGSDPLSPMVYLPGKPMGQVFRRRPGKWEVVVDEVPDRFTDMAFVDGQILMVGEENGTLWLEATRPGE